MVAYNIQVVTDFNAVTHHFLNTMYIASVMGANKTGGMMKAEVGARALVHAAAPRQDGADLMAQSSSDMVDGDTPIQREILKLFKVMAATMDDSG
jgi:hypothetical protein